MEPILFHPSFGSSWCERKLLIDQNLGIATIPTPASQQPKRSIPKSESPPETLVLHHPNLPPTYIVMIKFVMKSNFHLDLPELPHTVYLSSSGTPRHNATIQLDDEM